MVKRNRHVESVKEGYRTDVQLKSLRSHVVGLETVALRKTQEAELGKVKMRRLRLFLGVTVMKKTRNINISETPHIRSFGDKWM